ncbi:hypothetical protein D3C73_1671270 [compost metagenome]
MADLDPLLEVKIAFAAMRTGLTFRGCAEIPYMLQAEIPAWHHIPQMIVPLPGSGNPL